VLEAQVLIWIHRWSLDEWLQLVAWVRWSTLDTEDSLDWLLLQDWVTKSVSHVWELLLISPLNVVFGALIVIVVGSCWTVLQLLLEVKLLSLGEPGAGGLSPSVVVLEESVVQVRVEALGVLNLVEALWNIADLIQVLWSDLRNVQISQEGVVAVELPLLLLSQTGGVDVVGGGDVFVWQNNLWLAELVTWGLHIVHGQVVGDLGLIDLEEKVLLADDLVISLILQGLLIELTLEVHKRQLTLNDLVNLVFNLGDFWDVLA